MAAEPSKVSNRHHGAHGANCKLSWLRARLTQMINKTLSDKFLSKRQAAFRSDGAAEMRGGTVGDGLGLVPRTEVSRVAASSVPLATKGPPQTRAYDSLQWPSKAHELWSSFSG